MPMSAKRDVARTLSASGLLGATALLSLGGLSPVSSAEDLRSGHLIALTAAVAPAQGGSETEPPGAAVAGSSREVTASSAQLPPVAGSSPEPAQQSGVPAGMVSGIDAQRAALAATPDQKQAAWDAAGAIIQQDRAMRGVGR